MGYFLQYRAIHTKHTPLPLALSDPTKLGGGVFIDMWNSDIFLDRKTQFLEFLGYFSSNKGCFSDFLQNYTTIMMIFNTLSLINYVLSTKNLPVISMGLSVLQLSSSKKAQKSSV